MTGKFAHILDCLHRRPNILGTWTSATFSLAAAYCGHIGNPRYVEELSGEIAARLWLGGGKSAKWLELLEQMVGEAAAKEYATLCPLARRDMEAPSFPDGTVVALPGWWQSAQRRVRNLIEADGILPVVGTDGAAVALPFKFENYLRTQDFVVVDAYDNELPVWTNAADFLARLGVAGKSVRIKAPLQGLEVSGASLQLALAVAAWRKFSYLTGASHLDIIATGRMDENGLRPVQGVAAKAALAAECAAKCFIFPEDGDAAVPALPPMVNIPFPEGAALGSLLDSLPGIIEPVIPGILDWRAANRRIDDINETVNFGQANCAAMLAEVDACRTILARSGRIEEGIRAETLRAALLCHLGRPEESLGAVESVFAEAADNFLHKEAARLLAFRMISLSDNEDYDNAINIGEHGIRRWAERKMSECDRRDGLMRLRGSLGQSQLFRWMLLRGKRDQDSSLANLQSALKSALEHEDARECLQNYNYLHFWHAATSPLSPASEDVYQRARAKIAEAFLAGGQSLGKARERNYGYLYRQRWFELHRHLLLAEAAPTENMEPPLPDERHAEGWTRASSLKYRAAIRAARGDFQSAIEDFAAARALLSHPAPSPLFHFMVAAIDVETWLALWEAAPNEAEAARRRAAELLELRDFGAPARTSRWRLLVNSSLKRSETDPRGAFPF